MYNQLNYAYPSVVFPVPFLHAHIFSYSAKDTKRHTDVTSLDTGTRVRKADIVAMASSQRNEKVAEELVEYAARHDVKAMFEYYLQRY